MVPCMTADAVSFCPHRVSVAPFSEAMLPGLILEVAVNSLERATAAERAGAHRVELCAALEVGGLTPGLELIRQVRSVVQIPIHVMVRPRTGGFVYSADEFSQMNKSIKTIGAENVQGVVTGVLLSDGSVDIKRSHELAGSASPMQVTFHRAFDESRDLTATLEDIVLTGAHRILTSGGAADAHKGALILRSLIQKARNRITILPGGGLHPGNIAEVARVTGARELHTGLGGVIRYSSADTPAFESAVRNCIASLGG
jgi:copper homeostasis protein